jgi:hypothetical protein
MNIQSMTKKLYNVILQRILVISVLKQTPLQQINCNAKDPIIALFFRTNILVSSLFDTAYVTPSISHHYYR